MPKPLFESRMTELLSTMWRKSAYDSVPIMKAVEELDRTQFVTSTFSVGNDSPRPSQRQRPLFSTMASSPVAMRESEMRTLREPSMSIPSELAARSRSDSIVTPADHDAVAAPQAHVPQRRADEGDVLDQDAAAALEHEGHGLEAAPQPAAHVDAGLRGQPFLLEDLRVLVLGRAPLVARLAVEAAPPADRDVPGAVGEHERALGREVGLVLAEVEDGPGLEPQRDVVLEHERARRVLAGRDVHRASAPGVAGVDRLLHRGRGVLCARSRRSMVSDAARVGQGRGRLRCGERRLERGAAENPDDQGGQHGLPSVHGLSSGG